MQKQDLRIIPICVVVFLGFLGFSLPFPLFSPMILDSGYGFIPLHYTHSARMLILALILSVYPLGQLIGCPFLGQLSDRHGRRKILLISLMFTFFSYVISAIGMEIANLLLLVISRFFCGIFEGNIVIANSATADISTKESKNKNFGYLAVATNLGFILGPLIGGKLADPHFISWFSFATPFWAVSVFVLLTFFIVFLFLKETYHPDEEVKKRNIIEILAHLYEGFQIKSLKPVYIANFFLYFGMFCYFNYLPLFLVKRFMFTPPELAWSVAYVSFPMMICAFFIIGPLSKRVSAQIATAFSTLLFSITLWVLQVPSNPYVLYYTIFFIGIFLGVAFTNMVVMVSNRSDEENQGRSLGINQSIQVLSEVLAALIGGLLGAMSFYFPMIFGGLVSGITSLFVLSKRFKRHI